jgi:hypothetical protein
MEKCGHLVFRRISSSVEKSASLSSLKSTWVESPLAQRDFAQLGFHCTIIKMSTYKNGRRIKKKSKYMTTTAGGYSLNRCEGNPSTSAFSNLVSPIRILPRSPVPRLSNHSPLTPTLDERSLCGCSSWTLTQLYSNLQADSSTINTASCSRKEVIVQSRSPEA